MALIGCGTQGRSAAKAMAPVRGVTQAAAFDDDQAFPDTATLVFEYPGDGGVGHCRRLPFEMRRWSGDDPHNRDSGAEFHGTEGMLSVSKQGKLELLDGRTKRVEIALPAEPLVSGSHRTDFVSAIREGRKPRAGLEEGLRSVALVHLGNIAVRLQRPLLVDPAAGRITGDDEANGLLARRYRPVHWAVPERAWPAHVGPLVAHRVAWEKDVP